MRRVLPQGTIDTACVIALDSLNLIPALSLLFARVLLPKAVRTELFRRRAARDRIRALLDEYAFLERCDDFDQGAGDVLLVERMRRGTRDRGEVEAVVQAAQVGAVVVVDDRWGRELARRYGLKHHGTLWVLRRLHELGLLSADKVRAHLVTLFRRGLRLPLAAANTLLADIGQEVLSTDECAERNS